MKYIFFLVFSSLCCLIIFMFIKVKEKKFVKYLEQKKDIVECKKKLLELQNLFIECDLKGNFKKCPNTYNYLLNIIEVLNRYDEIKDLEFRCCSIKESMKIINEQQWLTKKAKHLVQETSRVSNKLCYSINPIAYMKETRKKKVELQIILFMARICKFIVKMTPSISDVNPEYVKEKQKEMKKEEKSMLAFAN